MTRSPIELFWTAKKSFCVKLYVYCCHMGSIWSIQFHQNECHNHFGPNSKVFSQAMTRSRMKGAKCIKDSFESQSDQLSATGLTCHRQSIISSFKIASEKLNHLSLSWCTFLITLPRLRSAFYIKKSFSKMWDWQATFAIYLNSNVSTFLITLQRLRSVFYINKQCSKMWYFKAFQCPSPTYLNSNVSYFLLPSKG